MGVVRLVGGRIKRKVNFMATITQKELGGRIKALREDFGYSQEELAKSLKIGRPAITQIEAGARDINSIELAEMAKVFDISIDTLLDTKIKIKEYKQEQNELKKQFKKQDVRISVPNINKDKFKNVLLYVLEKCGAKPNVGETVLYKLLYFADFNFFELYEELFTGATYRKIQYGPAPQEFTEIVNEMIKKGEIKRDSNNYYGKPQKRYLPLIKSDLTKLKATEKEVLDKVIEQFSDYNATEISDRSHEDTPWKVTPDKEIINYDLVFYRTPSYSVRTYSEE